MKIAFIHPFLHRYARGIERYTINLSKALVEAGIDVDILTWQWANPIQWPEHDSRVGIVRLPVPRYFAAYAVVPLYIKTLFQAHYDLVLLHFADYGEANALNGLRRLGYHQPFSIVWHYPYSQVPHRYNAFIQSGLIPRANHLIAVSDFVAQEARAVLKRPCDVISHGVVTETFLPNLDQKHSLRKTLGLPLSTPLLLSVSALEERKGIQWVLKALPFVRQSIPDVVYVIVGNGPYEKTLHQIVADLQLEGQVIFIPATADVSGYYQAADLMLILAKGEASSIVTLESLACETPVLASMHPPFNELIKPEWGCQVNEADTNDVAQTIVNLLREPAVLKQMGQAGRAHILEHHTWKQIGLAYINLFSSF